MISREAQATLLLLGTIVGVGMFAIPFVFSQAGFLTGLIELAALGAAATVVHLAYAEVVLRTPTIHRLPGYVGIYFGEPAGWMARISHFLGLGGSLLAYVVLGGSFLGVLISGIYPGAPIFAGPLIFYLFGAAVIFRNIRFESVTNAILTLGLIGAIVFLALILIPKVSLFTSFDFNLKSLAVPYGVLLFAMAGAAVIPDLRSLLLKSELNRKFKRIIIAGTVLAAAVYLIFAFLVFGATGQETSADAISGLAGKFGSNYLLIGSAIGFLAAITSFITLGLVLKGMLISDFGLKIESAWFAAALIPGLLYLLGFNDFIKIISLVGAVAIGIDSIFILLLHREAALRHRTQGFRMLLPREIRFTLLLIFAVGVFYELYAFLY